MMLYNTATLTVRVRLHDTTDREGEVLLEREHGAIHPTDLLTGAAHGDVVVIGGARYTVQHVEYEPGPGGDSMTTTVIVSKDPEVLGQ